MSAGLFYETKFKCRCMPFLYQRESITHQMNGVWKSMSHMSLTNLTTPWGLHRVFYKLKDDDLDNLFSDDEEVWIPVKYHKRRDFNQRWY